MEDPAITPAETVSDWLSRDQETKRLHEWREKALHDEVTRYEGALAEGIAKGIAEARAKGKLEGRTKGIAEGETNAKLEVAMNLLANGFEVSFVVETTGLPETEVRRLIEKNVKSHPSE